MAERLVLVGMMGAGKSTVGVLAAARLGWRFIDVDEEIARTSAATVSELFAERGESGFREIESQCLRRSLDGDGAAVVSAGGGAVLDGDNRAVMRGAGPVVWLRARPETLAARVGDGSGRPLLAERQDSPAATLSVLAGERAELYAEVADLVIDVDDLDPEAVAALACRMVTGESP